MKRKKKLIQRYKQILKYGFIGSFCAGLDFLIYTFLTSLFGVPYLIANIISIHIGIIVSFFLNRYFTFKVINEILRRFLVFYLVGITGLLLSSGLLFFFIEKMNMNELFSKLITIVFVALIQFLLNKNISFKNEK
jgi:putative flippase GtrA